MKKLLYITNCEVPYRARFFTMLAEECDLTVVYEKPIDDGRNKQWSLSAEGSYRRIDLNLANSKIHGFWQLLTVASSKRWDMIVIGCLNSPIQALLAKALQLIGRKYVWNVDGEVFIDSSFKGLLKKVVLRGACAYLAAGEKSSMSLKRALKLKCSIKVVPYMFSSLTSDNLYRSSASERRSDFILVVGQYLPYKGLDIAIEAARRMPNLRFKLVGMDFRTEQFIADMEGLPDNVEVVPFLQKSELETEYGRCRMMVLPSRQECWGLVINEAASFGCPIVSTWGSGAAIEIVSDNYPQFLAEPGNVESLCTAIRACMVATPDEYGQKLQQLNSKYSINEMVVRHIGLLNSL